MRKANLITAIGTPLTKDEQLNEEGLEMQLLDQRNHGFRGILAAGTMGATQLLTDETYRRLVKRSSELFKGHGELLVGAGDTSFARTRDRILFLNGLDIDGVAVLAPFFWKFSQAELIEYYSALADESRAPLYLYDLPQVVGTSLTTDTIQTLARHPNIAGAKCSGNTSQVRQWIDLFSDSFRIIIANVELLDMLIHHGVREILDGMWSAAPAWTMAVADCAAKDDWEGAARNTGKVSELRCALRATGIGAYTVFMNARGIPGIFAPRPCQRLTGARREELLAQPIVRSLVEEDPAKQS